MTKKRFTIYGNCQSTVLAASLQRVKSFKDKYQYVRLPFCHRISSDQYKIFASNMKDIDLLITQPVSSKFRGGGFDSHYFSKLASNVLGVPSLQFYGYFPELSRFKIPKLSDTQNKQIDIFLAPFAPLSRDSLYHYDQIKKMVLEKMPSSLICHRFDSESSHETEVKKCLSWTLKYLLDKEATFNLIPISDFIQSNWQTKHLFYTPRHPSGHVMAELVKRICEKLNLNICNDELSKIIQRDHFSCLKLYIPKWLRESYLPGITEMQSEDYFTMSAVDTVSLYTNLYRLIPGACLP